MFRWCSPSGSSSLYVLSASPLSTSWPNRSIETSSWYNTNPEHKSPQFPVAHRPEKTMTPRLQRGIFPASTPAEAIETAEWLEAFADLFRTAGSHRCVELLQTLLTRAREYGMN